MSPLRGVLLATGASGMLPNILQHTAPDNKNCPVYNVTCAEAEKP